MKSERSQLILKTSMIGVFAISAFSASVALAQPAENPVSMRTEGLPSWVAAKLIEKGQQGITAVTQYLQRTRMIHQLSVADVVNKNDPRQIAQQPAPEQAANVEGRQ